MGYRCEIVVAMQLLRLVGDNCSLVKRGKNMARNTQLLFVLRSKQRALMLIN